MTPLREAVVLPAIFLTVTLFGGFRVTDSVQLLPPPLTALVLAMLLMGTLARGRVLLAYRLMDRSRCPLENASGAVVLLALFAASAQAINLLLPQRGLLHGGFAILFFLQLLTINAAGISRGATLRTLLVLFGSLFVLRFIVIESLYAPGGGLLHRALTTLLSGATLGGIVYEPHAAVTGYVAFVTLILYLIGLVLLPADTRSGALVGPERHESGVPMRLAVLLVILTAGCGAPQPSRRDAQSDMGSRLVSPEQRAAALRAAQVWREPEVPLRHAVLSRNPSGAGSFAESDAVQCRLVVKPLGGTTPKFDCELPGGEIVRVKYGRGNAEIYAEVVATRLLSALGFGADRMYVVRNVRCAGCSRFPFQSLRCLARTGLERLCLLAGVDRSPTDFHDAVIERRFEGRRIESHPDEGWAWFELDSVAAAAGGAPRAHVDALKLFAIFIAHWDNKAGNQRLVCLPDGDLPDGGCSRPFAILQDLGATFGPVKLDLHNWRAMRVWADPHRCRVSMAHLPWRGATFPDQHISEEGRQFLLNLLQQLSETQIEALFDGARIAGMESVTSEGRQPKAWTAAFLAKVQQIREGGPCPRAPGVPI